jgi:ribosomal protein S18 acetylase RimI-like enzyme
VIRLARAAPTDIAGIAAVVDEVWGQAILPDVCRAQIENDACAIWVTRKGHEILGFASAFLAVGAAGHRRWEVDLLAVRRASQGQGLGQGLIQRTCQDAERHSVALARAVIRVSNASSQRAFEKAGFSTDGEIHRLFLWAPQPGDIPDPLVTSASVLTVDTLTYRGLWIEGVVELPHTEQRVVVEAARAMVTREDRLNTGALVPADGKHLLAPDLRSQAEMHGEYCCFIRPSGRP